ncbi:hypothetical protein PMZ80_009993 [Knufia obscura]|uniref:NTF2-like domain-containing protein n=1 Tax=Knufia obscura TaxID=1635080 RepID=A0ABR0RCC2_9EURO|nr:hypothetical protein PMZ80_009993 [Knufia obscura]
MKFAAALASLAVLAAAAPAPSGLEGRNGDKGCVSREHVQYLVDQETVFLQHTDLAAAQAAADAIFAADIEEYGDSINSLRQAPLGTIVETDKVTYVNDTLSTPAIPQIDSLSLTVDCNQFVWQWRFYGIGPGPNPYIQGFTLVKVNSAGLINYQYVEFNSLAWAENSGYTVTPPTTGPFAAPPSK